MKSLCLLGGTSNAPGRPARGVLGDIGLPALSRAVGTGVVRAGFDLRLNRHVLTSFLTFPSPLTRRGKEKAVSLSFSALVIHVERRDDATHRYTARGLSNSSFSPCAEPWTSARPLEPLQRRYRGRYCPWTRQWPARLLFQRPYRRGISGIRGLGRLYRDPWCSSLSPLAMDLGHCSARPFEG